MIDPDLSRAENRRLGNIFPHDGPNSPWLYRLMVLRDDIWFEVASLGMEPGAMPQSFEINQTWRTTYFIRRLSLSLTEAHNIWNAHVDDYLKTIGEGIDPVLLGHFKEGGEQLKETAEKLKGVRNSVGGHVRLANAAPRGHDTATREDYERGLLRTFEDWEGLVCLSKDTVGETSYRGLTITSLLLGVGKDTLEEVKAWHADLSLLACCGKILAAIDTLIFIEGQRLAKELGPVTKPATKRNLAP